MLQYKHYVLVGFRPRLDAEIVLHKSGKKVKNVTLNVWTNYRGTGLLPMQVIFSRQCKTEEEAVSIMKSFGHGFEYTGAKWVEIK